MKQGGAHTPDEGAPANGISVSGTNQSEMRAQNERLVLTLLRRKGSLARAEIARLTGLSAQTAARLITSLEKDGLIKRGEPQRGRVGQPSIPMSLNRNGAFFLGLKVGRRSVEVALIDFLGAIIDREKLVYDYPDFDTVRDFAVTGTARIMDRVGTRKSKRVAGLGIAIPFHLWNWAMKIGVSPDLMANWQTRDLREELSQRIDLPIFLQNDASAACSAELAFGEGELPPNFVVFFLGFFIGGGLVLRGSLYTGSKGNAAGFGPLIVPNRDGESHQLINHASLSTLERRLIQAGRDYKHMWESPEGWDIPADILEDWLEETANALAHAIRATQTILDLDEVLIDGWLPRDILAELTERISRNLSTLDITGINWPKIRMGTVGPDARFLGAASLPLTTRYMIE